MPVAPSWLPLCSIRRGICCWGLVAATACHGDPAPGSVRQPEAASPTTQSAANVPASPAPPRIDGAPSDWENTGWTLQPTDKGVFDVQLSHASVLGMRMLGFGARYQWSGQRVEVTEATPQGSDFRVVFAKLPITAAGRLRKVSDTEARMDLTFRVTKPLRDISGVGFELAVAEQGAGWGGSPRAQIVDDRDVRVEVPGHGELAIDVQSKLDTRTYYEKKKEHQVRMLFLEGDVEPGTYPVTLSFAIPDGGAWLPALRTRYGPLTPNAWHRDALVWNDWPVDLSDLNRAHGPAGSHGRVVTKGDALVFEDGTPARFWGTNVTAAALFEGTDEAIALQAKRISALGYNLVRLHHHDVDWIRRSVFGPRGSYDTTQKLDASAMDRIDWWIKCLRDEGVYVWLDLHTGRVFQPGDAIPSYDELAAGPQPGQGKAFNYVNPRVETLMERFAEAYLGHLNPHTKLTLGADPSVVGVLVTNENDLMDHYATAFGPGRGRPAHTQLFNQIAEGIVSDLDLPARTVRRIWAPGPGRVLAAEMQHRFDARALAHLRGLGIKPPLATTNSWGFPKLTTLAPLASGDIIDVHAYGTAEELSRNPRQAPHWLHNVAMSQVVGKPLTVSEWNIPYPHEDRFTATLWAASMGALQGWDAMMAFALNLAPNDVPRRHHEFAMQIEPSMLALAPAAALMYRRGDVRGAEKTYVFRPGVEGFWNEGRGPANSAALRTLPEQSRVVTEIPDHPALSWDDDFPRGPKGAPEGAPKGAIEVADLDAQFLAEDARAIVSDTGELHRDWVAGLHTIDTPRTQAVSGWVGGRSISLGDATFDIETPKAAVVLSALDDLPLATSKRILVSAIGRAALDPDRRTRVRSEPVEGSISLKGSGKRALVVLTPTSRAKDAPTKAARIRGVGAADHWSVELPTDTATHWFLIVRED